MNDKKLIVIIRTVTIIVALSIFISSLFFDSFSFTWNGRSAMPSLLALLTGWLGLEVSWFANPLLLVSVFFIKRNPRLSVYFSGAAVLLALFFLRPHKIMATEAGHMAPIEGWLTGYWLWLSACAVMFLGSVLVLMIRNQQLKTIRSQEKQ